MGHECAATLYPHANVLFSVAMLNGHAHGFPGEATRKAYIRVGVQMAALFLNVRGTQPLPRWGANLADIGNQRM